MKNLAYVKQLTIKTSLNRSLRYIVNDKKTDHGCLVTGVNCASNDNLAYKQMLANKKMHDKEKGILGFHFIQSFKENEINDPYQAHEIGLKWAKKMFDDKYQFILSTHMDKGHIHNHVIINSVSIEGRKFNACKQSLKDARDYSDLIAKEYDLSVIPFNENSTPKSYKEWNEEKKGNSWKAHIRAEIDTVIKTSSSFEDFMNQMRARGYVMKQGNVKFMTFKAPGMERNVRGRTLGAEYTEEKIKERIRLREFNFTQRRKKYQYRFKNSTKRNQLIDLSRRYKYKRGSLVVNFMLIIALIRSLSNLQAAEAKRRNARRDFSTEIEIAKLSKQLNYLVNNNIKSKSDMVEAAATLNDRINNIHTLIVEANEITTQLQLVNKTIDTYKRLKLIHDEYQKAGIRKLMLKKKYYIELATFEKAQLQLSKWKINEDNFDIYKDRQHSYEQNSYKLKEKLNSTKQELYQLRDIQKTTEHRNYTNVLNRDNSDRSDNKNTRI